MKYVAGAAGGTLLLPPGCRRKPERWSGGVELVFYTSAGNSFFRFYNEVLIPGFEREHPGIRVRVINQFDQAGYDSKLLMLIAGGMAPDVFHVVQENFPFYAAKEILLDLGEWVDRDRSFPMGEMYGRVMDAMRWKGKLVGLATDFSTIVMFYNKELFERGGVGLPREDWTWGEYLEVCRKLTRRPDVFATSNSDAYNRWPAYVWMNGGDIFTPDMSRCVMDSPEAIGGLRFYADLSAREKVARTPGGTQFGLTEYELFIAQKTAVYAGSRYAYKTYLEQMPVKFEWDCAPLPRGPAGRVTTFIWGGNCVMKSTKHPKEAWELVSYMSGPKGSELAMAGGNGTAPHRPTTERWVANPTNPKTPKNDRMFLEAIEYARQAAVPSRYALFADANLGIRDAFWGRRSAEEVCLRYTEQVNQILRGGRV